ncbi:MAG: metallophosphoesterase [Pseudomonadota bacterium]
MYQHEEDGNRFISFCLYGILIIGLIAGNAQSATLFEQSRQKLESRLAGTQKEPYTFVVMGDSRDNDEVFIKCLKAAAGYHPLFILHTGDAVSTGSEKQFLHFLALLQQTLPDMPVFVAAGNHELTNRDKSDEGKVLFQQLIGPLDYVLDLPGIHARFIILDNSGYSLTSNQIDYLKNQLSMENSLKFVLMHIPPQTRKWIDSHTFTKGADVFLQTLSARNVAGVYYGHYHLYDEDTLSGIRHIITGGAGAPLTRLYFGDPSYHFVVVTLSGGKVTTEKVLVAE